MDSPSATQLCCSAPCKGPAQESFRLALQRVQHICCSTPAAQHLCAQRRGCRAQELKQRLVTALDQLGQGGGGGGGMEALHDWLQQHPQLSLDSFLGGANDRLRSYFYQVRPSPRRPQVLPASQQSHMPSSTSMSLRSPLKVDTASQLQARGKQRLQQERIWKCERNAWWPGDVAAQA